MMSIYGRSATPTSPPRKHNHYVPDGYIPPKSRQRIFTAPSYAKMVRGGGSPSRLASRTLNNRASPNREPPTPRNISSALGQQNQYVLPYVEFSRPPSRPESRQDDILVDRKVTLRKMLQNFDAPRRVHSDHEHPSPQMIKSPSPSPYPLTSHQKPNSPRGILKSSTPPRGILKSSTPPRGILKSSTPPRGILKSSTPPSGTRMPNSPMGVINQRAGSPKSPPRSRPRTPQGQQYSRSPQGQQYCDMGGDDYTPPPSRQKKAAPQSCGLGPSTRRPPSSDGSQSSYGPISVVDKYDTRDSHVWQPHYSPSRIQPAKSSRGRPRMRNPNIIFNRVANAQDDGASCSSKQYSCDDDDDEEDEDAYCSKIHKPCAAALDWDHDPMLRGIECEERQAYRQCKVEEYLHEVCARQKQSEPPERFENYLIRCYAYANGELNSNTSKHILGYVDDHLSPLDVWILRLCRGTILRLARMGTVYTNRDCELFLRILREECVALYAERGSLLRRHLNETERRLNACNEQERNYKKILILSQRSPMGVMQHLRRNDYR
ncbi:hypothetical protein KC19_1G090600 [Ceratodon purpureus]|uniref:Uncharacterized protein n=1 Tax=Ceratodon purpureus TaxID=3225 RepID=A0A8T0J336_CERPU|nr:hypothetical protein KC19_1G090600 [Ceratodon purpureus]